MAKVEEYPFWQYPLSEMFDLSHTGIGDYLLGRSPWHVFSTLGAELWRLGEGLGAEYAEVAHGVWVHRQAVVAPDVCILPPCVVCEGATIRPHAYLRGNVLVGRYAMVGHCCEIKNSILFDRAVAAHFNYVGDSILGCRAHLGAGAILSNVRSNGANVTLFLTQEGVATPLAKLGALVGDQAEIGCNCVLNPGTVVGQNAVVYPLCSVKGCILPLTVLHRSNV